MRGALEQQQQWSKPECLADASIEQLCVQASSSPKTPDYHHHSPATAPQAQLRHEKAMVGGHNVVVREEWDGTVTNLIKVYFEVDTKSKLRVGELSECGGKEGALLSISPGFHRKQLIRENLDHPRIAVTH